MFVIPVIITAQRKYSTVFIFVFGPQLVVLRDPSWLSAQKSLWQALGNIWDARNEVLSLWGGCLQGKHPTAML